ncbi:MAG: hypothetical protein ACJ0US_04595 [Arenicellales bacterium]
MLRFRNILAAVSAVLLLGLASSYMPIAAAGDLPTEKGCKTLKDADERDERLVCGDYPQKRKLPVLSSCRRG